MAKQIAKRDTHKQFGKTGVGAYQKASEKTQERFKKLAQEKQHALNHIHQKKQKKSTPAQKKAMQAANAMSVAVRKAKVMSLKGLSERSVKIPVQACPSTQTLEAYNDEQKRRAEISAKAFSGPQQNKDTCGLMAVQSILLEMNGSAPEEGSPPEANSESSSLDSSTADKTMISIGMESGRYIPCNGTSRIEQVMTQAGIPSIGQKASISTIADSLDKGKAVVVLLDARPIWFEDKDSWPTSPLGHFVRVTGVKRRDDGTVEGLYVNDSGNGSAGVFIKEETFNIALDNYGGVMGVSKKPILSVIRKPNIIKPVKKVQTK